MAQLSPDHPLIRAQRTAEALLRIDRDPAMHALSYQAWIRMTLELGGFKDVHEVEAMLERIEGEAPVLHFEVVSLARRWRDFAQDRPAPAAIASHEDKDPRAYMERRILSLSPPQVGAGVAYVCAQIRPPESFGKLNSFDDLDQATAPFRDELARLDAEIAASLLFKDPRVQWELGGRPVLKLDGLSIQLGPDTLGMIATLIFELMRGRPAAPEVQELTAA